MGDRAFRMSELKKTFKDGTPPVAAHRIVSPGAPSPALPGSSAGGPPAATGAPAPQQPPGGRAGGGPGSAQPSSSGEPAPSSDLPAVPPPPGSDELTRSRPPSGRRTPAATRDAPSFGPPMPENAPGWMLRARRMSLALEEAIQNGQPSASLQACIDRAWAAWELDGATDKHIVRVARLIEKAHVAIRETPAQNLERALNECAQVLSAGLPRHAKARQDFSLILSVVQDLRGEADPWAAVVDATSRLLGWAGAGRAHAAQAVRVAIMAERGTG